MWKLLYVSKEVLGGGGGGELVELSMQQIVDCDGLDGGCQGGEMQQAFAWTRENGGLCTLEEYPYTSGGDDGAEGAGARQQCKKCQVGR